VRAKAIGLEPGQNIASAELNGTLTTIRRALPCLLAPVPAGGQTPAQFAPVSEPLRGQLNDPLSEVKVTVVVAGSKPTPAYLIAAAISFAVTVQLLLTPGGFVTQLSPWTVANRTPLRTAWAAVWYIHIPREISKIEIMIKIIGIPTKVISIVVAPRLRPIFIVPEFSLLRFW
jgi:hypothetical protein